MAWPLVCLASISGESCGASGWRDGEGIGWHGELPRSGVEPGEAEVDSCPSEPEAALGAPVAIGLVVPLLRERRSRTLKLPLPLLSSLLLLPLLLL